MMSSSASGSGDPGKHDLDEMMKRLGIREDLDDVVFEEEEPPPAESARWLAILRLHMEKEYSEFWFYKNMRTAWVCARG